MFATLVLPSGTSPAYRTVGAKLTAQPSSEGLVSTPVDSKMAFPGITDYHHNGPLSRQAAGRQLGSWRQNLAAVWLSSETTTQKQLGLLSD
jgi:hypothetical protein